MDPSTPTTSEFDLSAALEDAEGHALVEAIHDPENPRLAWNQGREVWAHYAAVPPPTYDPFKESRLVLGIDPAGGPESAVVYVGGRGHGKVAAQLEYTRKWMDEYDAFMAELRRDPYEQVRDVVESARAVPKKQDAPAVSSVRWACKTPTAPKHRKGTSGWMQEQMLERQTHWSMAYSRKLNEQIAGKVDAIHEILGVKQHGTND